MSYKFLIIGGLHGNEPLGISLVNEVQKLNLPNIKAVYGNPKAIEQNVRFMDEDLNRVFPGKKNGNTEQKRAFKLMQLCNNFDFVIDFHNTYCPNNNCGFVGGENFEESLQLASVLGLNKVIVADYNCINKYVKNCLSVEISLRSSKNNVDYWLEKILNLVEFNLTANFPKLDLFQFKYRVSREEQNKFNFSNWKAFKPISKEDVIKLDLDINLTYMPIFVDDLYTSNYNFAGLVSHK